MSIIWQIKDGKRGHTNQSTGLIQALSRLTQIETIEINVHDQGVSWLRYLAGRGGHFAGVQQPILIIGAGSQTHSTILAAGRETHAPTIVMMAPPRPIARLFDLCIVPEHDRRSGSNCITTKGVINQVEVCTDKDAKKGLFLIGGPSKHHNWDEPKLRRQIDHILGHDTKTNWTLTTSRRTPSATTVNFLTGEYSRCAIVPAEKTDSSWLPSQLARSAQVWVTEDSVSMIYEALSSGAKVGLLPVPRKSGNSRVISGVDRLIAEGQVCAYRDDSCDLKAFDAPPPLAEAARVAGMLYDRFFKS